MKNGCIVLPFFRSSKKYNLDVKDITTSSSSSSLKPPESECLTPSLVGLIIVWVLIHECKLEMPSRIPWASSPPDWFPWIWFLNFSNLYKLVRTTKSVAREEKQKLTIHFQDILCSVIFYKNLHHRRPSNGKWKGLWLSFYRYEMLSNLHTTPLYCYKSVAAALNCLKSLDIVSFAYYFAIWLTQAFYVLFCCQVWNVLGCFNAGLIGFDETLPTLTKYEMIHHIGASSRTTDLLGSTGHLFLRSFSRGHVSFFYSL